MDRIKKIAGIFLLMSASAVMINCEPQPDDLKLLDQFVISTNYDKGANFDSYKTYTIKTDTIGLISNHASDDTIIVGNKYARPVVEAVKSNLIKRGYSEVEEDENPDLAINIYIVKNLNIYQQYNPGNYYGSYSGYYNYYYGPSVSTYVNNTGVLVTEIIDLKNSIGGKSKIIWNAQMGDVYSSVNLVQQSVDGIGQAFNQSQFISTE